MTSGIGTIVDARRFLDPTQVDVVLYHKNCNDGFGAAWAAWKHLQDRAIYIPVSHDDKDVTDLFDPSKRVLMVDITLDFGEMEKIYYRQPDLGFLVLDHHKTAPAKCGDLGWKILHFDNHHSGAVLAWHYFSNEPTPQILRYVEDRDLWHHHLRYSKDINAALQVLEHDFVTWDRADLAHLRHDGAAIRKATSSYARRALATAAQEHEAEGVKFLLVNSPLLMSEIGEEALESRPDCAFVAIHYRASDGLIHASLRSRGDFDVSVLATHLEGGGHQSAAGFAVSDDSVKALINSIRETRGVVE